MKAILQCPHSLKPSFLLIILHPTTIGTRVSARPSYLRVAKVRTFLLPPSFVPPPPPLPPPQSVRSPHLARASHAACRLPPPSERCAVPVRGRHFAPLCPALSPPPHCARRTDRGRRPRRGGRAARAEAGGRWNGPRRPAARRRSIARGRRAAPVTDDGPRGRQGRETHSRRGTGRAAATP